MKNETLKGQDKKRIIYSIKNFKGVDYAHAQANVSLQRSTDCLNMVRSEVGKVRKRTGYALDQAAYEGRINGVHFLKTDLGITCLIHAKTSFYVNGTAIYSTAKDDFSHSVQMGEKLYILDGEHYLVFDGLAISNVKENAFQPTTYINRSPSGGGKRVQQANLLNPKRTEAFISDGASRDYYLSQRQLDSTWVEAVVYNHNDGSRAVYSHGHGCNVNTTYGFVTFDSPPPKSLISGVDNVYISYAKAVANGIEGCNVMKVFGKGGRQDTLFLSGNGKFSGKDWFSMPSQPNYFGEDNVGVLGLDRGEIMGYSVKDDILFTHKRNGEGGVNIFARQGYGDDENFFSYPIKGTVQGPGTLAKNSFATLLNEPLFLTQGGIYGLSAKEASQEQYTQMRSLFINPSLLKNDNLDQCYCCVYNDFYILATGENLYLLDGLQKSAQKDVDYSEYQYECYHWKIQGIRLLFVENNRLCFGTNNGQIGRFYTDEKDVSSYNDNGQAITALWQTPDFTADLPSKVKNLYRLWLVCAADVHTSARVKIRQEGVFKQLFFDELTCRFFKWSEINWAKFTWSNDTTPKLISRDIRIKNVDKMALKIENSENNEPFGLYEIGFEYTVGQTAR